MFVVCWTIPWLDLFEGFLRTWESIKDGQIQTNVNGERITMDQILIEAIGQYWRRSGHNQCTSQVALKNIDGLDAFVNKECYLDEGKISCQVCNNPTNHLSMWKVRIFQQSHCHYFELGKQGEENQLVFRYVDTNVHRVDSMD